MDFTKSLIQEVYRRVHKTHTDNCKSALMACIYTTCVEIHLLRFIFTILLTCTLKWDKRRWGEGGVGTAKSILARTEEGKRFNCTP